ncbi:hypothetical protein Bca52824_054148 [Brassica carinata]|uniref:Uncharacterized protein n=1 Tax=Brassica carinata TaxID=52824 RepID=A0A8X7R7X8_BRACI|nr:hypothetical protein Bca52824_054148 [Brassica carinata]
MSIYQAPGPVRTLALASHRQDHQNLIRYQPVVLDKQVGHEYFKETSSVGISDGSEQGRRHAGWRHLDRQEASNLVARVMNETTHFMEVLKTFINKRQWSRTLRSGHETSSTKVPDPRKDRTAEEG